MITSAFMLSAASSGKMFVPCLFKAALLLSAAFSVTGMYRKNTLLLLFFCSSLAVAAQLCTTPGQTPVTAKLVCGTESFYMNTPVYCGNIPVPVPCPAGGFNYTNKNPNFFRMNCFQSGTLGFTIVPDEATADYNWQLFDITGSNPNDVFTNPNLFVACNWSADPGETGASFDGTSLTVCNGGGLPTFSQMPSIVAGRAYMLMVSNENSSIAGYNITFTGGNAGITDPIEPHVFSAWASCTGNQLYFRANKKMQCNSVSADGSDFVLSNGANILSAVPGDCTSPLGSDSVIITLSQPLQVGSYSLALKTGSDGNTLLDVCNREIPLGEAINFTVTQPQPVTMDSIYVPGGCSPAFVDLAFKKGIQCNTIAPNGSDFRFSGPQTVLITVPPGSCSGSSLTTRIRLVFTTPLVTGGTYHLSLVTGSDGNTLLDECGLPVIAGAGFSFNVVSPLSAAFTTGRFLSCRQDSVRFFHDGNNNTVSWAWNFGNGQTSSVQNPVYFFDTPGPKTVSLVVANSLCADTSVRTINIPGNLKASFEIPPILCAGDTLPVKNTSTGSIDSWQWHFGDGTVMQTMSPSGFRYQPIGYNMYYTIQLVAGNSTLLCADTVKKTIQVLQNCLIKVPTAFTPNGDGLNDFLFPLNAVKASSLEFRVYNRNGQMVFFTRDWTRKWDGTVGGIQQPTGVYAWLLSYTNIETGEAIIDKGTTVLIR